MADLLQPTNFSGFFFGTTRLLGLKCKDVSPQSDNDLTGQRFKRQKIAGSNGGEGLSEDFFPSRETPGFTLERTDIDPTGLDQLIVKLKQHEEDRARRIEEQNHMFAAKKLGLVLDLDHTLLNSVPQVKLEPVHHHILIRKEEEDREKAQRHLFCLRHIGMWTKLRPGIWNFLEKASKLYELHICTMGDAKYATEMATLLDPTGVLFGGRVLSKRSNAKVPKCKDFDGVLGTEYAAVIMDDKVDVWPDNKFNLMHVNQYNYFPSTKSKYQGRSLLELDSDEGLEDGTLQASLAVLERIHEKFFSSELLHVADVRKILAAEQLKVLNGCHILFSGIPPADEPRLHQHPLWQTAKQFGAVCTTQMSTQVTHVVGHIPTSEKANWAPSTGRFKVSLQWIKASAFMYQRAKESDFTVK